RHPPDRAAGRSTGHERWCGSSHPHPYSDLDLCSDGAGGSPARLWRAAGVGPPGSDLAGLTHPLDPGGIPGGVVVGPENSLRFRTMARSESSAPATDASEPHIPARQLADGSRTGAALEMPEELRKDVRMLGGMLGTVLA